MLCAAPLRHLWRHPTAPPHRPALLAHRRPCPHWPLPRRLPSSSAHHLALPPAPHPSANSTRSGTPVSLRHVNEFLGMTDSRVAAEMCSPGGAIVERPVQRAHPLECPTTTKWMGNPRMVYLRWKEKIKEEENCIGNNCFHDEARSPPC
ncbi:hypothetical protein ACP70R_022235 [Stipagrostis hirtigluma subsp. patula]